MLSQNLTSNTFLKFNYNMESETVSMNFLYFVKLWKGFVGSQESTDHALRITYKISYSVLDFFLPLFLFFLSLSCKLTSPLLLPDFLYLLIHSFRYPCNLFLLLLISMVRNSVKDFSVPVVIILPVKIREGECLWTVGTVLGKQTLTALF